MLNPNKIESDPGFLAKEFIRYTGITCTYRGTYASACV